MKLHKIIRNYKNKRMYPLHMPGHKRMLGSIYEEDFTEIPGLDDLHSPKDTILELMQEYSDFYGARRTYISVNGSTAGILAAVSTIGQLYEKILVMRNSHKSLYNGLYINNIQPKFLYPLVDENGIVCGYDYNELEKQIKINDIQALFITSPTYEGIIIDKSKILDICNKNKVCLIVDEAHGAHLIRESFASCADIVIQSLHKTLPCLTSSAIVHCNNDKLIPLMDRYMSIYQTTSPSYVILKSISECMEFLKEDYQKYDNIARYRLNKIRNKLKKCNKLRLIDTNDIYKIVISCKGTSIDGIELFNKLYEKKFVLEMAAPTYIIAMTSCIDEWDMIDKFVQEVINIDSQIELISSSDGVINYFPKLVMSNQRGEVRRVKIIESIGKISNEQIYMYPPGIPLVTYGEKITEELIEILVDLNNKGYIEVDSIEVI